MDFKLQKNYFLIFFILVSSPSNKRLNSTTMTCHCSIFKVIFSLSLILITSFNHFSFFFAPRHLSNAIITKKMISTRLQETFTIWFITVLFSGSVAEHNFKFNPKITSLWLEEAEREREAGVVWVRKTQLNSKKTRRRQAVVSLKSENFKSSCVTRAWNVFKIGSTATKTESVALQIPFHWRGL